MTVSLSEPPLGDFQVPRVAQCGAEAIRLQYLRQVVNAAMVYLVATQTGRFPEKDCH
jgi:hypothetical protein